MKPWLEKQLSMIASGSTFAEDIRYALNQWPGPTRFLDDGRLEHDTNPVENAIRPICLTRKNALFAGRKVGAGNWILQASLVAGCKLNDVNPVAYIAQTLEAIIAGHPQAESMTSCHGDSAKRQASINRLAAKRLRTSSCFKSQKQSLAQSFRGLFTGDPLAYDFEQLLFWPLSWQFVRLTSLPS
ncbi:IS66 family transposase [Bradyrhizobium valentinum]|uniref:IS66 family transposase n=1 Tax=Bradyrhizobium valentinum TaxID=1518501 RepID=UPI001FDA411A|nr:transposase [Bradyrhizobium valentinum]